VPRRVRRDVEPGPDDRVRRHRRRSRVGIGPVHAPVVRAMTLNSDSATGVP